MKYSFKYDMTTVGRNQQEQRIYHFHTTTTFFTDHSLLLLFHNDVMAKITSGRERARGTLLFYREISHVKSKLENSIIHVYPVLSSFQFLQWDTINCTVTNIAYDRIYHTFDEVTKKP